MIYFDNASTTKTLPTVNKVVVDALESSFYNPSSLHTPGFAARQQLEKARRQMLSLLHASNSDLIFTGSATEANNLALFQSKRGKVLVGAGEHPSILAVANQMIADGRQVEFVPLDRSGVIDKEKFLAMLSPDVSFVSIQFVSNETGAINDIAELAKETKKVAPRALFHSDMVQALGKIDVDIARLGVDLATFSAHKIHGPKGVGALVFSKNIKLKPQILGGGQEKGVRSGTENLPLILGFVAALDYCLKDREIAFQRAKHIKARLVDGFEKSGLMFNVHGFGSPFILSVSFADIRGESLMHALETEDILIATGSACSSKKVGNTTLEAMGHKKSEILGNIRISFGHEVVSEDDIDKVVSAIARNVKKLKD